LLNDEKSKLSCLRHQSSQLLIWHRRKLISKDREPFAATNCGLINRFCMANEMEELTTENRMGEVH